MTKSFTDAFEENDQELEIIRSNIAIISCAYNEDNPGTPGKSFLTWSLIDLGDKIERVIKNHYIMHDEYAKASANGATSAKAE